MVKIKEPSVAGTFYSSDKEELQNQINYFKANNKNTYSVSTRAVIVPHAGLFFSGRLAYEGINQLDKNIKNIFIFAPAHRVAFEGLALTGYDEWSTPFGNIAVNKQLCEELAKENNINFNDEAFAQEHSVEIQVPIIQSIFENVEIIPILVGRENFDKIEEIIGRYYSNTENGFIISSDLSHFLNEPDAKNLDIKTATMIESGDISQFRYEQACGALSIAGLIQFANKSNYSLIRIDMATSADASGDKSRVVGYGCWFLYEGSKFDFIKKYYSDFVLNLVKTVIELQFNNNQIKINYPQIFDELGACFVTLEKNNRLRGCIGSIIAHQPLINDIIQHSKDAAFNDYRFNPLQKEELNELKIAVSILTEPKKMDFDGEEDLLEKIIPYKDGIIIKDGRYQAVYLPSVWEELPDKKEFLNSLKMKAGLRPDYFSKTFEAYRFETVYIKEE